MGQKSRTIVFVNGAWMNSRCWDNFRQPFEAAGYEVHTLNWPYLDGPVEQLQAHPPKALGGLSIKAIVDHYADLIESLPEPPIIIGHSFGGLFTQMLLDRGLGWAGIALEPAPIGGIVPGPITAMAALPIILRWAGWAKPFILTRKAFDRIFANTAPAAIRDLAYPRLVVPTSGWMFFQNAFWIGTFVNPKQRTQPLLITAAQQDKTVSPYVSKTTFKRQKRSRAPTDFVEFSGLSHFMLAEPGWESVAGEALKWAERMYHFTGKA